MAQYIGFRLMGDLRGYPLMGREIAGILGNRGAGKSCFMVRNLLEAYQSGRLPVSNLTSIKFDVLTLTFEQFRQMPPELSNAKIGWDELAEGADSYDFMHKDVKKLTKLFAQVRKLHAQLEYTVQRWSMVPRRMRLLTDMWYLMVDLDAYKGEPVDNKGRAIVKENGDIMTHRDICDGLFEVTEIDSDYKLLREPYVFDGRPIYPLYDTDEIIEDEDENDSPKSSKIKVDIT